MTVQGPNFCLHCEEKRADYKHFPYCSKYCEDRAVKTLKRKHG